MEDQTIDYNKEVRIMVVHIKRNKHYSSNKKIKLLKVNKRFFGNVKFDESCWYQTEIFGNHINKLTGFSTDLLGRDVVRFGWKPSKQQNSFEIYAYVHIGGKWVRSSNDLINVIGTDIESFSIIFDDYTVMMSMGDKKKAVLYPVNKGQGWLYWFYFGGKPKAPWDMKVGVVWGAE
jgi:hypothetical protein